jgi:hypothetical protein
MSKCYSNKLESGKVKIPVPDPAGPGFSNNAFLSLGLWLNPGKIRVHEKAGTAQKPCWFLGLGSGKNLPQTLL